MKKAVEGHLFGRLLRLADVFPAGRRYRSPLVLPMGLFGASGAQAQAPVLLDPLRHINCLCVTSQDGYSFFINAFF